VNMADGVLGETVISQVFRSKYRVLYIRALYNKNIHSDQTKINHNVSINRCDDKCSVDREVSTHDVVQAINGKTYTKQMPVLSSS